MTMTTETDDKRFDTVLKAAFEAGAMFGGRYPDAGSWPDPELDVQFEAFRAALRGDEPWSPLEWFNRRQEAYTGKPGLVQASVKLGDGLEAERRPSLGEQMGHVGGHYG